jgi:hypothetical protein
MRDQGMSRMRPPLKRTGLAAGLALALGACASGPDREEAGRLGWLAGCWRSEDGLKEERWSYPLGGVMFGHAATLRAEDGALVSYEQSRIDLRPAQAIYAAYPNGVGPVAFTEPAPATADGDDDRDDDDAPPSVVFENAAHDYPQRIVYARPERDELTATVSRLDGSDPVAYSWRRCE